MPLSAPRARLRYSALTPKPAGYFFIGSYPTETQPRGFNNTHGGGYLLAPGQQSNSLSVYKINAKEGTLKRVMKMGIGNNPNWIEIIELS